MSETYIFGNVGQNNAQIGTNTMLNTTGDGNSAFGNNVFTYLTSGVNNSGFGVEVASGLSFNGSNNTAYGVEAMKDATTASNTTAFGYQAATLLTTGNNNTLFGRGSGGTLTGSNNTIVGTNATVVTTLTNNSIVAGYNAIGANASITVGAEAQCLSADNIVMGYLAKLGDASTRSILIGGSSGSTTDAVDTVVIGFESFIGTQTISASRCLYIGIDAGITEGPVEDCVGCGLETGAAFGSRLTAIGPQAMGAPDSVVPASDCTALGYFSGISSTGTGCTFIGYGCAREAALETGITVVGGEAMENVYGVSVRDIADTTNTTINANPDFNVSVSLMLVIAVDSFGNVNDAAPGTAVGVGGLTGVVKTVDGTATSAERFLIDFTGATPAFLSGKYFLFSSTTTDYYAWYDVDNLSIDPMVVGRTGVEINIGAGNSASTIANTTRIAIANVGVFTDYTVGAFFRIVNAAVGNVTDISPGTAVGISVVKIRDGDGVTSEYSFVDFTGASFALGGTYFEISSPGTDYYVWFNFGTDVDPVVFGKTGIEVTLTPTNFNTVMGWRALNGDPGGTSEQVIYETTAIGYQAGLSLNTGSNFNTIIGADAYSADTVISNTTSIGSEVSGTAITNTTVLGARAAGNADRAVIIGANSSVTGNDSLVLGPGASAPANTYQIGENVVSGAATLNFRTQLVADESWIGGGSSSVIIDNSGNIVRGTDYILETSTTDNTTTTMETYTMADNTTRLVEALVMGTRTGGTVGNTADTYSVRLDASIKRTGLVVAINTVNEIHLQDQLKSFLITNLATGNTHDLAFGTASGASRLQSFGTVTQGTLVTSEVSVVDFADAMWFNFAFTTRYFTLSSPTTEYYVWWNNTVVLLNTDPLLPGRTGIQVDFAFEDGLAFATLTQIAISAVLDFTCVITSGSLQLTSVATGGASDIKAGTAALGNAGELTGVATALQGVGAVKEISLIDFTGATGAGLAGKYFTVNSPSTNFYIWYNTGASTDPGGVGTPLAGVTGVMISVLVGDAGSVLASKTLITLSGTVAFTTQITPVIPTTTMRIENVATGSVADIAPDSSSLISATGLKYLTVMRQGASAGVAEVSIIDATGATPAGLDGTYFFLASPTVYYYVWYRVDGVTPDPLLTGTSIPVDIITVPLDDDSDIAAKTAAAISAITGGTVFTSVVQSPWVIDVVASGTNAVLTVAGSIATNITWKAYTRGFAV